MIKQIVEEAVHDFAESRISTYYMGKYIWKKKDFRLGIQ